MPSPSTATTLNQPEPQARLPQTQSTIGLQVIGQFADLYILCSTGDGLLVIDQHAAHERLLYEEFRRQYLEKRMTRQNLLFPATIELSILEGQLFETYHQEIDQMGFTVREFGGNSFIISAVPALSGQGDAAALLREVLHHFGGDSIRGDHDSKLDSILASMACKAAVKAGTHLESREIDDLLARMAKADLFSHCPHGRPVVRHFSHNDVKKWFYRT